MDKKVKKLSPVSIIGPPGLAEFVDTAMHVSKTWISMKIVVYELVQCPVSQEEIRASGPLGSKRLDLWRQLVPPDQMNSEGFTDIQTAINSRKVNEREAQYIKKDARLEQLHRDAVEGAQRPPSSQGELTWTFRCEGAILCTAAMVKHNIPSWGFCVEEPTRAGRLDADAARALGVPPGKAFARLKAGEAVTVGDKVIQSEQVVSPDRRGRKLVYVGDCTETGPALRKLASRADIVLHGAKFPADAPSRDSQSTSRAAGEFAAAVGAQGLILTHLPVQFRKLVARENAFERTERDMHVEQLVREAGEAFGHPQAVAAGTDGYTYGIPRREDHHLQQ
mmetsp:Transcript_29367/g.82817  ORF Transcript_29367/g.82817 Transcript_29367/m.82817 type:complete len:336 (-) Transcript_29367:117-1124(-)